MPGPSPSFASILLPVAIALGASSVRAEDTPGADPKTERRQLQSIEVDADGTSGVIRTAPEFLGEAPGAFYFGAPHCRSRALSEGTLEQLHQAMRTRQAVTVRSTEPADAEHRCIRAVVFWAPEP